MKRILLQLMNINVEQVKGGVGKGWIELEVKGQGRSKVKG